MPRSVLILGGTRNLGHYTALHFHNAGDRVTVLNRGITRDELPPDLERLRADRTNPAALKTALGAREFDLVVDTTVYTGAEADQAAALFTGRVGHYLLISTGQVYLVRPGLKRPFVEDDYPGAVMPAPEAASDDYAGWEYGVHKRDAEDRLFAAGTANGFPLTTIRLPMIHSERDHYDRVRNVIARLVDGGPLLVPAGPAPALRHVWVHDVVRAIARIGNERRAVGCAYNLSQNETVTLEEFLAMFAARLHQPVRLLPVRRDLLTARRLLPDCAPFSGRWMSELDNQRSVRDLGITYTPLPAVIEALVADYVSGDGLPPAGYATRPAELALAAEINSAP